MQNGGASAPPFFSLWEASAPTHSHAVLHLTLGKLLFWSWLTYLLRAPKLGAYQAFLEIPGLGDFSGICLLHLCVHRSTLCAPVQVQPT